MMMMMMVAYLSAPLPPLSLSNADWGDTNTHSKQTLIVLPACVCFAQPAQDNKYRRTGRVRHTGARAHTHTHTGIRTLGPVVARKHRNRNRKLAAHARPVAHLAAAAAESDLIRLGCSLVALGCPVLSGRPSCACAAASATCTCTRAQLARPISDRPARAKGNRAIFLVQV